MKHSDDILEKYQVLIKALIPYQQKGKLLEGLNRFSSRLPDRARDAIKNEVIRLTTQTQLAADNSEFAQFPVKKYKHFGINMMLDKVGAEILKKETSRYLGIYTVGVLESVTNSEYYQNLILRKRREKIIDAFTVQTQSFDDIDFGDDLAIAPNFTVSSTEFLKGRNVPVSSISHKSISLYTTRPPNLKVNDEIELNIPDSAGIFSEPMPLNCLLESVHFNKNLQRFESNFSFSNLSEDCETAIKSYVKSASFRQPLSRNLELERTMQALDRDRILEYSPWVPVFLQKSGANYSPKMALVTRCNSKVNPSATKGGLLPGAQAQQQLFKELDKFGDVFVLRGSIERKNGEKIKLCSTLRILESLSLLRQFIAMTADTLTIQQLRIAKIDKESINTAVQLQDINREQQPDLLGFTHVLYCRQLNETWLDFSLDVPSSAKPFPRYMIDENTDQVIDFIMHEDIDRRKEARYYVDKPCSIKVGMLSSINGLLKDFSVTGMRIQVAESLSDFEHEFVRISVPAFKIKSEKYKVLGFSPLSHMLRLQLCDTDKVKKANGKLMVNNTSFFKLRDIAARQHKASRFMWELASRAFPSVAVQIISGRTMANRLKTVYVPYNSSDLYPFVLSNNEVPLHGVLADMESSPPDSKLMHQFIHNAEPKALVTQCIRKKDNAIITVSEQEFSYSPLRLQIAKSVETKDLDVSSTSIECILCDKKTTLMSSQRMAQISKIDIDTYEKLVSLQNVYTHILHIINITPLQRSLMTAGINPVDPQSLDESTEDSTER